VAAAAPDLTHPEHTRVMKDCANGIYDAVYHASAQNWTMMHRMAAKNLAVALGIKNTASSVPTSAVM
jgi:hypothetical protein